MAKQKRSKNGRRKPRMVTPQGGSVTVTYSDKTASVKLEITPRSGKKEV